jgi:ParB family chromosome partitioning protein
MSEMRSVTISSISVNPYQPRTEFDEDALNDLASSIKEHGIIQPLVVTEISPGKYQLISGERRFRAAQKANLTKLFVVVRDASEQEQLELAIVENVQRRDLNPIERARAYRRLMNEFGLTQAKVAEKVGKTRAAVANTLRMLDLPQKIQTAVSTGAITEGHAKVIAGLPDNEQMRFFDRIVQGGFSVRETEAAGRQVQKRDKKNVSSTDREDDDENLVTHYKGLLEGQLATKVDISEKQGTGTVSIHFFSEEELQRVVRAIIKAEE